MTNLKINDRKRTIEITKAFAKKASIYGSPEYITLKGAKSDNLGYRVITVAPKRTKPTFKGLSYDYMEKYIKGHDDENKSIMAEFLDYRAKSEMAEELLGEAKSYGYIKKWFLETYPEFEAFQKNRKTNIENIDIRNNSNVKPELEVISNAEKITA